jgi:hypothetical protein
MAAQLSYDINQPLGYPGLIYAQAPHDIVSMLVETVAGIPFGVAVSRGTDPANQVVVGGADFLGVTIRSLDKEGAINTGAIQWNETEAAGVMRSGYIHALCTAGCVPGDDVFYATATGLLSTAGDTQVSGTWETTTAAGELGVIRLTGLGEVAP